MGPFRPAGSGREIKATPSSFQWTGKPNRFGISRRCFFKTPSRHNKCPSRVMSVSRYPAEESSSMPKRVKMGIPLVLGFSDEDKFGIIQSHDDVLVVILRIGGYNVKG